MSHPEFPVTVTPTAAIAAQLKALRKARGWSAQRMADAMTEEGFRWDRFTVSNIENGRRASISVEEWLAIAYVLGVAPIHLVVPVTAADLSGDVADDVELQVTSRVTASKDQARDWIRGRAPFGGHTPGLTDEKMQWLSHMPIGERTWDMTGLPSLPGHGEEAADGERETPA